MSDSSEQTPDTHVPDIAAAAPVIELCTQVVDPSNDHDFGDFYEVPELGLQLKKINPGSFYMGTDTGPACERPRHRVHMTRRFWMGIYPLTQGEFKQIMGKNPSMFNTSERLPAEKVSWNAATDFCRKLTELERRAGRLPEPYVYRLPTEAEWEYTCRAGIEDDFATDVNFMVWYYKNANETSHEVGLKEPNNWGFFDMQGNVWEWTLDGCEFHDPEYYEQGHFLMPTANNDIVNPHCKNGTNRIAKGGCWLYDKTDARPSARFINPPDSRYFVLGLRVLLGEPVRASLV